MTAVARDGRLSHPNKLVPHRHCRPAGDETRFVVGLDIECHCAVGIEVGPSLVPRARKLVGAGTLVYPGLSPRVVRSPRARFLDFFDRGSTPTAQGGAMEVLYPHCAGLDVHKDSVVACVRHMAEGKVTTVVKTFMTTTGALMLLSEWLSGESITHIAMEATGVYWKPVWHILSDGEFELVLANAAHIKNVPGRKTDVNDATWIAELLAHGLIRASFVPGEEIQELRVLMRTRKQLVREQTSHTQRLQKTLEDANIKLDSLISDILGVSGRRMLEALIAGESDAEKLAALAHRRSKAWQEELQTALHGQVTENHRFLLHLHLRQIDGLAALIAEIDHKVADQLRPFRD